MNRAMSVTDMLRMKKETYPFEGDWADAFGAPERGGVWFIWDEVEAVRPALR